ncbi:hypothetical protein H8L32_03935 [Undibacterium sp. CY18W]|uniref:Uncharacterized protein n=1 Tax=Undibacterium hunanense TaxID=2762292 RepID=A0ABR6ZM55_9BURK|nr:hypothetical protein [Undibacterium hunanense]MBC3916628.1 hypothetical protein [Undibacterium hunanense]
MGTLEQVLTVHFRKMKKFFSAFCWSAVILFSFVILPFLFDSIFPRLQFENILRLSMLFFIITALVGLTSYLLVFNELSKIVKLLGKSQIIWVWGPLICTNGLGILFCYTLIQQYNPGKNVLDSNKQFNAVATELVSEKIIKLPTSFASRFFLLFGGLATIAAARGYIDSSSLNSRLSNAVTACYKETERNMASLELVGQSGQITQTIVVPKIGEFAFPIGMRLDEIWSVIRNNLLFSEGFPANTQSSNANWSFSPMRATISAEEKAIAFRWLRGQGELKATYKIFDVNGRTFLLEGDAGSSRSTTISAIRPFFGADSWCNVGNLSSNAGSINKLKTTPTQDELLQADKANYAENNRKDIYESYTVALLLLAFGIVPAIWYFLLRRLHEIAVAIRGE